MCGMYPCTPPYTHTWPRRFISPLLCLMPWINPYQSINTRPRLTTYFEMNGLGILLLPRLGPDSKDPGKCLPPSGYHWSINPAIINQSINQSINPFLFSTVQTILVWWEFPRSPLEDELLQRPMVHSRYHFTGPNSFLAKPAYVIPKARRKSGTTPQEYLISLIYPLNLGGQLNDFSRGTWNVKKT